MKQLSCGGWIGNVQYFPLYFEEASYMSIRRWGNTIIILENMETKEIYTMENEPFIEMMEREIEKQIVKCKNLGFIGKNCPCIYIPL